MFKKHFFLLFAILTIFKIQTTYAHYHDRVYVVEAPAPVYVVQQAPVVNVVEVQAEPPADLVENMTECPSSEYAWINGHWSWNGKWEWSKGYWGKRPHLAAVWMPGHWRKSHHDHRWVWEEGNWR